MTIVNEELFEKLRNIKMIVTDVDGTLTYNWLLSCAAVNAIRKAEANGIRVSLISSNTAAFISTLAKYLGISGYTISEGGAVIMDINFNIVWLVKPEGFDREKIIKIMEELGFRSILNEVKFVDVGFFRTEKSRDITTDQILKKLEEVGITNVVITDSKYAVHVLPEGADKASALKKLLEITNLTLDDIIVVGDGDNDLPLFKMAKLSAAPANATENIKRHATIVLDKPNGEGFADLVELILLAKREK